MVVREPRIKRACDVTHAPGSSTIPRRFAIQWLGRAKLRLSRPRPRGDARRATHTSNSQQDAVEARKLVRLVSG